MRTISIAIDGPSGSGKSTAAKNLARELGIEYIDTGAMYRAVALKSIRTGTPPEETAIAAMLADTDLDFSGGHIFLDGEDVEQSIRTLEVSSMASKVSALPSCRTRLVELQRKIAGARSVVMDGRDIGTNVLPDADYKFFITASIEQRARRRWEEIKEKDGVSLEDVRRDLEERDYSDMTRPLNPLIQSEDATELSTDHLDIRETTQWLLEFIRSGEESYEKTPAF